MTPERLLELIRAGETMNVEFKGEQSRQLSDRELIDAVVCLANRPGQDPGWLLIGVEDDGRITGARARHESGRTKSEQFAALVAARTRPSLSVSVASVTVEGEQVLVLEVPQAFGTGNVRNERGAKRMNGAHSFSQHRTLATQGTENKRQKTNRRHQAQPRTPSAPRNHEPRTKNQEPRTKKPQLHPTRAK